MIQPRGKGLSERTPKESSLAGAYLGSKQMAGKVAEARKTVVSMWSERSAALNAAAAAKKQADDFRY